MQDVPNSVEEHDDNSDREDHGGDESDNHPSDCLDLQRWQKGNCQTCTYKPDDTQKPGKDIRLSRLVGLEDDDADEHETFEDDKNYNLHLAIPLTKRDKCGFGKESNEQRDEIPALFNPILTPQWFVIWRGIKV